MIDKYEMFIALAREQHFGRAAEACHVTQPTLSSAIRALEEFYGIALVRRGSRFMGLTPEGEKLLLRARNIVAEARAIRDDFLQMQGQLAGELKIGVIPSALSVINEVTQHFSSRHPEVRLTIRALSSQSLIAAMEDFQIDLGVGYAHDDEGKPPSGGFVAEPLYQEKWAVLHRNLEHTKPLTWQDLPDLNLCLLSPDMQNRRILDRILSDLDIKVEPRLSSSSLTVLVGLIQAGAAEATVLPDHPARFYAQLPGLNLSPLPDPTRLAPRIALIAPAEGRRNAMVSEFLRASRLIGSLNQATKSSIGTAP